MDRVDEGFVAAGVGIIEHVLEVAGRLVGVHAEEK
jgi:hypothetical protein